MTFGFSCAITYRSMLTLKGMYDGIKQAIGPMQSRIAPLKSATGDAIKDKQMERWVEHYSELNSRVNVVSDEALMAMESLFIICCIYIVLSYMSLIDALIHL